MNCVVVVVIGPSGAGKSTVGERLAHTLDWPFIEGDVLHPPANIEKMRAGIPLTETDRAPWLDALRERIADHLARGTSAVVACSALKRAHRDRLRVDAKRVQFVYLQADEALLQRRLETRSGHFMKRDMLRSQLEALESPDDALIIDAALPVEAIVTQLQKRFQN
jgi:gluconokinase